MVKFVVLYWNMETLTDILLLEDLDGLTFLFETYEEAEEYFLSNIEEGFKYQIVEVIGE